MELTGTPLFFSQLIANMSPSFGFFIKIFSAFNHFYFISNTNHHHLSPILLLQKPPIWTPCFYSFPLMACFQQNSLSDSVKMSIIQGPMQKQSWPQISEFFSHWRAFHGGATYNRWTTRLRKQTREDEYSETGNTGSYCILGTENSRRGHSVSLRTRTLGRSPPSGDVVKEGCSCFQR